METFAERLRNLRKTRGLSQTELADKVGIKQNQYSRYENGTVPENDLMIKFAVALECTLDYLLMHTDHPGEYRQYETLPEDEQTLIDIYRAYKRGDPMSRAMIKALREMKVIDHSDRPLIEAPKESDVSSEQKTPN